MCHYVQKGSDNNYIHFIWFTKRLHSDPTCFAKKWEHKVSPLGSHLLCREVGTQVGQKWLAWPRLSLCDCHAVDDGSKRESTQSGWG
jgi:hypothetical protein